MNYYYDVILNFDLDHFWKFYEWEVDDYFTIVKKIPLFRVSFETICDFLMYQINVSQSFCEEIAHKTTLKDSKENFYASFLISDTKNSLAVLLNENGRVIALSNLCISDSNHLNEYMYTLKEVDISYQTLECREFRHPLRQKEKMKNFVLVELNTLFRENNVLKMKYLYYEWFHKEGEDITLMYQDMVNHLPCISWDTLSYLDYFIRLSFHQV